MCLCCQLSGILGIRSIPPALACSGSGRWVHQVRPLCIFTNRSRRRDAQGLASSDYGFVSAKGTNRSSSCKYAQGLEAFWLEHRERNQTIQKGRSRSPRPVCRSRRYLCRKKSARPTNVAATPNIPAISCAVSFKSSNLSVSTEACLLLVLNDVFIFSICFSMSREESSIFENFLFIWVMRSDMAVMSFVKSSVSLLINVL